MPELGRPTHLLATFEIVEEVLRPLGCRVVLEPLSPSGWAATVLNAAGETVGSAQCATLAEALDTGVDQLPEMRTLDTSPEGPPFACEWCRWICGSDLDGSIHEQAPGSESALIRLLRGAELVCACCAERAGAVCEQVLLELRRSRRPRPTVWLAEITGEQEKVLEPLLWRLAAHDLIDERPGGWSLRPPGGVRVA